MVRTDEEKIVYLDTHVVLWLYDGLIEKLSATAKAAVNENELRISQMVKLELQFLYEVGRIKTRPKAIIDYLGKAIGLRLSDVGLDGIVETAMKITWARDVFDRLIAAEAATMGYALITKDEKIQANFSSSLW